MIRGVPYDAEVKWIQTASNAYINTGIAAYKSTDPVRSLVQEYELAPIGYSSGAWFHGNNGWNFFGISGGKWFYSSDSGVTAVNGVRRVVRAEVSSSAKRLYVDGTLVDNGAANNGNTNLYYLYIGGIGSSGGGFSGYGGTWRVGRCRIWKSGTLVRDLIPVRVGSVGYMYDRVTRSMIGKSGAGSLGVGPDVATPVMGLHFMRGGV